MNNKLNINELLIGLLVYFLAIYLHEFGHYIVAKYYNKLIDVRGDGFPEIIYYTDDIEEETNILGYGIVIGFIIIFTYGLYLKDTYGYKGVILFIIYLIFYFIGSGYDIERLFYINSTK